MGSSPVPIFRPLTPTSLPEHRAEAAFIEMEQVQGWLATNGPPDPTQLYPLLCRIVRAAAPAGAQTTLPIASFVVFLVQSPQKSCVQY